MKKTEAINFGNAQLKLWDCPETGISLFESGWKTVIDTRPKSRLGQCRYHKKEIAVSSWCLNGGVVEGKVQDTLLHELAHALTRGDGHGRKWKNACIRVGANPNRCASEDMIVAKRQDKYKFYCSECSKHLGSVMRRSKTVKRPGSYRSRCCKSEIIVKTV